MPKNKDANDAWVKGAQFIDLVNLGTKEDPSAKKSSSSQGGGALYINPGASKPQAPMMGGPSGSSSMQGGVGFQPMAHLNE